MEIKQKSISLFKIILLLVVSIGVQVNTAKAQTKAQVAQAKRTFTGTWYCKKEKRTLQIYFVEGTNYATISDAPDKQQEGVDNTDVYKAFIKGSKLVMYADGSEHRSPYCQILLQKKALLYQCNGALNYKDNFIKKDKYYQQGLYYRIKEK